MPLGAWGRMTRQQVAAGSWRARARIRDLDGTTRLVERWGTSGAAAERALQAALLQRSDQDRPRGSEITVAELAADWLTEVRARGRTPRTVEQYERTMNRHVVPGSASCESGSSHPGSSTASSSEVTSDVGPSTAKTVRSVLSGMAGIAIRRGELRTNPVRDAAPISQPFDTRSPRALTIEETAALRAGLLAD